MEDPTDPEEQEKRYNAVKDKDAKSWAEFSKAQKESVAKQEKAQKIASGYGLTAEQTENHN